jgi:hypothetical protein
MSHRLDGYLSPKTSVSTNGNNTLISSQSAIGANSAGGDVVIQTGTGTLHDGYIYMYNGGVLKVLITPAFTAFVASFIDLLTPVIAIDGGQANPKFYQFDQPVPGIDGSFLTIQSQSSTTSPARGGDLILSSGDGYEFGTTIQDGYVRLQTGTGRDGFVLDGTNASFFARYGSYGSGQNVIFIHNATTTPTADPTGGGILFVENGALKYRGPNGTVTTVAPA